MEEAVEASATKLSTKYAREGVVVEGRTMVCGYQGAVKEDMLNCMRDHVYKVIPNISTTFVGAMQGAFIPPVSVIACL